MEFTQLLQEGRLEEALGALQLAVRRQPERVEPRVDLFALECLRGRWDKALAQLETIVSLDREWTLSAQVYRTLIAGEGARREVFAGQAQPQLMGEPEDWVVWNIHAFSLAAQGRGAEAQELRARAFEAAPEYKAVVQGQACAWLSDADRRIGPVLEAFLDGRYYWIPFRQLQWIEISEPEATVEVVWCRAKLGLSTGAEVSAYLPARYVGTELRQESALILGRETQWQPCAGGGEAPVGARLFESDQADYGIFECGRIEFEAGATPAQEAPADA